MSDEIKLLDVVALTVDVPEHNLSRGQVGTVVELLKNGAHTRLNSAIAMDARISLLVCARITLWFYITNPKRI